MKAFTDFALIDRLLPNHCSSRKSQYIFDCFSIKNLLTGGTRTLTMINNSFELSRLDSFWNTKRRTRRRMREWLFPVWNRSLMIDVHKRFLTRCRAKSEREKKSTARKEWVVYICYLWVRDDRRNEREWNRIAVLISRCAFNLHFRRNTSAQQVKDMKEKEKWKSSSSSLSSSSALSSSWSYEATEEPKGKKEERRKKEN